MYIILLIILFIIIYFLLNIYEKFKPITKIKNLCYNDLSRFEYHPNNDNYNAIVSDYLKHCKNTRNLEISVEDLMKLLYNKS